MVITVGIAATTRRLDSGFQHSVETLERFADFINREKPLSYLDHRTDMPPFGRLVRAWVEPVGGDEHHALHVEIEHGPEMSPDEVREALRSKAGLSMSFFGEGICNYAESAGEPELVVAFSDGLNPDYKALLVALTKAEPDRRVAVRTLHEHTALGPTSVLIWIVGTVGAITLDVVLRDRIKRIVDSVAGAMNLRGVAPGDVRFCVGSGDTRVEVRTVWRDDPEQIRSEVTAALRHALAENRRSDDYASLE